MHNLVSLLLLVSDAFLFLHAAQISPKHLLYVEVVWVHTVFYLAVEFLSVGPQLTTCARLDSFFYLLPILAVSLDSEDESLMLLLGPPTLRLL